MTTTQILMPLALLFVAISGVLQILYGNYKLGAFLIFITILGIVLFYFQVWGNR